ncbi:endo-1,4-beta-xylanase [Rhodonellum psychrophilum GCM71 = DSM 17998]|uniref:Beta-xylanase n=2 Tax=Rhodonellum TaxID=336827 RepID=U5C5U5_9BACT|nr:MULTISPECIES: endo-1,4-beta-xylanase [Rhodonellum]ERM83582.1 endo-1,4-beta-xylanase [Rhodonellum psychrophilum GCM71 = DSM 17998]SDY48754.1 endo-1,4-beta-xylanase [Rhodonellum ikkaensis]
MKNTKWNKLKKGISLAAVVLIGLGCVVRSEKNPAITLKDAFEGKFYIGAAMGRNHIHETDASTMEVLGTHFNSIVAENVMKSGMLQAKEGEFNFSQADKFVEYGKKNNLHVVGHTLIWHSQAPRWFFTDAEGKDVSPEVLAKRMETHIKTVVGRYKGQVKGWDVVNEAILDDGSWRKSKFFEILGEDFIKLAFQYAHEADPEAELYYNDYSMANSGKRAGVVKMVKDLQAQEIKIDGIGMQGHLGLEYPTIEEFEKSILAYSDLGVTVMITEMDLSVLPSPRRDMGADVSTNVDYQQSLNPYTEGLPDDVQMKFNARYLAFFKLFLDHHDKISRVTLWGVNDGDSWKNGWPVRGRTDYPLLFNRDNSPKTVVNEIIQLAAKYE